MAVFHHDVDEPTIERRDAPTTREVRSSDRVTNGGSDTFDLILRLIAGVVAAIPTIIGIIALARIDWSNGGMDAPAVRVADMLFTPWVAVATVVGGVLAIVAAASWDRELKFIVGALLCCVGVAILIADSTAARWDLGRRHGWMSVGVGAVLILTGILTRHRSSVRREVARDELIDGHSRYS